MSDVKQRLILLRIQIESARSAMDALTAAGGMFQSTHSTHWPMLEAGLAPVQQALRALKSDDVSDALKSSADRAVTFWDTITAGLDRKNLFDLKNVLALSAVLAAVMPALDAELRSEQSDLAEAAEIAFAHLKRSIVVDTNVRTAWQQALEDGEVECERRGALHLLSHRLWAFKAHAAGGYTDLVIGEPISSVDETEIRAARGLVLTEWKVASATDLEGKLKQLNVQLDLYQEQTLAAVELRRVQYGIIVSKDRLRMPPDVLRSRTRRRFINIPVDPEVASKTKSS